MAAGHLTLKRLLISFYGSCKRPDNSAALREALCRDIFQRRDGSDSKGFLYDDSKRQEGWRQVFLAGWPHLAVQA